MGKGKVKLLKDFMTTSRQIHYIPKVCYPCSSMYLVLIQTATAKGLSAYQEEGPELFLVQ